MSHLRFGLVLPQGWIDGLRGLDFEHLKSFALRAEELGFDSLYAYDHFIPYYEYKPLVDKPILECWTLISAIAAVTSKIRIGEVVTCNSYRNPALLAKMASSLDYISNGRLDLGIGAGWYEEEYISYGYEFPAASVRIDQLDEALVIIRSMWLDRVSNFRGRYYRVVNAINYPKPIQRPHPPIMVGGYGRSLLKVAAKHANIYNCPFVGIEEFKGRMDILKEHCLSIGRDHSTIEKSLLMRVIVVDDEYSLKEIVSRVKREDESVEDFTSRNKDSTIIGYRDDIVNALRGYASIGVTHFILHILALDERFDTLKLLIDACKAV